MSKGVETNRYIWYNMTKARIHTKVIGTPEELPTSDVTRGCAEIGADDSDERSTMVQVQLNMSRKVAFRRYAVS